MKTDFDETENSTPSSQTAQVQTAPQTEKHSKLKSAKLWVTIWAVAMVSFIVFADRTAFTTIAQWLCGVPLAYIGANVWQKQIYENKK